MAPLREKCVDEESEKKGITLVISNEDIDDIVRVIKSLEIPVY